jgi:hypothetical protein
VDVTDEGDESGGGEQADPGYAHEVLSLGHMMGQLLQTLFDVLGTGRELIDILEEVGEHVSQQRRHSALLERRAYEGDHLACPGRDVDAVLSQMASHGVDACGSRLQITGSDPM